jgi:hypothetical protein
VAALLLTLGAELIDAIANRIGWLFHLWLFHGHEKQARGGCKLTQRERAPPEIGLIAL